LREPQPREELLHAARCARRTGSLSRSAPRRELSRSHERSAAEARSFPHVYRRASSARSRVEEGLVALRARLPKTLRTLQSPARFNRIEGRGHSLEDALRLYAIPSATQQSRPTTATMIRTKAHGPCVRDRRRRASRSEPDLRQRLEHTRPHGI
jgi:hypothetical protein